MQHPINTYKLRGALCDWIEKQSFTHAITLNTDRELSLAKIERIFGTFCHQLDRFTLGRKARVLSPELRLRAIAFPENLSTNAHLHVAADLSQTFGRLKGNADQMAQTIRCAWLRSTHGSGSIDMCDYRDRGWGFYMTKGFDRPDAPMFLSSQFHPH
jgi:hypothetical protein